MSSPLPPWLEAFRAQLGAEVIETHISWLLLADGFAWKLKKPITLPFLDYGSATRRQFFCQEELRLNRRFAPELYLGLEAIGDSGEWAVKMRRFAESQRLDHVCARGALTPEHLSALARVVHAFHRAAATAPTGSRFGEPEQIRAPAIDNFTAIRSLRPDATTCLDRLEAWTETEFARIAPRLAARKAAGHVRECHGDLHLGNMVLLHGDVVPFDCIEFNDDFRWIDVASELAFTYVDLLDHQRPGLAAWLLNEWLIESGDFDAVPVLRFYAVYKAMVRAKVAAFAGQPDTTNDYLAQAERLTMPPRPQLVITHGLSGSGKSSLSAELLRADPGAATLRLRSDVERKRLFGLAPLASSRSCVAGGIYTPEATRRTYARLTELAGQMLDAGWSVIVDAAFLKRSERDSFAALAQQHGADFAILACGAPLDELRRRLLDRRNDPSEATVEVLERQLEWIEALGADECTRVIPPPQRREPT
ncbi:AAA family ATPase [Zoogloea sp.]|uniref:bifunctional aminoglycoside phosphotransferase/ATP-binding protein n=1 Tax=Zoogloea sp. TaxID=49181 RepID=UPI0035B4E534